MNKLLKFSALTTLLTGATAASAATAPLPTNFVQSISVQLTVTTPGTVASNQQSATVKVATIKAQDVIKSIGAALGDTFSAKAAIFYVAPITYYPSTNIVQGKLVTNYFGYPGTGTVQIRDGTNIVDITTLFQISTVSSNITVSSYAQNKQGGYSSFSGYSVRGVVVTNTALAFVTTPLVNVPVKGTTAIVVGYNNNWTSFCGVTANGVLQGTISATYAKLE